MHFIIIAKDHKDAEALARRNAVREAHLNYVKDAHQRGEQVVAAAMLNDDGNMCGSVIIVDFPDRSALDVWLEQEAYVTGNVWDINTLEIIPCKIPPLFLE
jgi:hypothetical protein|tara:strand:- start:177 stop:479 length:303 start_codon:yes stop_codon:yes gene_type:complete